MQMMCGVAGTGRRISCSLGHGLENIFAKKSSRSQFSSARQRVVAKKNILIAEDFPIVRQYLTQIFKGMGYRVIAVSTGKAAIRKFSDEIDLIFLDIGLHDIDGITVIHEIKQKQASYQRTPVPIIASMATSDVDQSSQYIAAGADAIFKNSDGAKKNDFKRFLTKILLLNGEGKHA